MEPTQAQVDAFVNAKLDPNKSEWVGKTLIVPFETRWALVNEHGSITYCEEAMLEAHKAGVV